LGKPGSAWGLLCKPDSATGRRDEYGGWRTPTDLTARRACDPHGHRLSVVVQGKKGTNLHLRVAFLPWAPVQLKSLKFLVPAIEPQTLAEHLKKRRRELCLRQLDAASLIGVDEETYWHWEKGRAEPQASSRAGVVPFLGYDPSPPPATLGERLRAKRREPELSLRDLARRLGWDPETIRRYERDASVPTGSGLCGFEASCNRAQHRMTWLAAGVYR